jgi:hypothetical protein
VAEPLLRRRQACGADAGCIKGAQLSAIAAFQARGAPVEVPAPAQVTPRDGAAQGTPSDSAAYVINGMQLGSNVGIGSADYLTYDCAASAQYAGLTACQRQATERGRRRRSSESTSFLHAADGSAVYINQSYDGVDMDGSDASDEVDRLSARFGKASVLPMADARGVTSGLIASWGAVTLLPLQPEQRAALADGTAANAGVLVDSIGNLQRSAQLGLPIYRLGGGAGYVWSASWNTRGRGTLRMLAIDASKLPVSPDAAKPATEATLPAPAAVTAAPVAPPPEAAKPVDAAPPQPAKVAEPATAPAPRPAAPAASADVRVVGPPTELRATAPAAAPATTASSGSANALVIFLTVLVVVLLGAVTYLWNNSRGTAVTATPAPAPEMAAAAPKPEVVVAPASEKMDLPALVPPESPDSMAASTPDMEAPKDAAMAPAAADAEKRSTP